MRRLAHTSARARSKYAGASGDYGHRQSHSRGPQWAEILPKDGEISKADEIAILNRLGAYAHTDAQLAATPRVTNAPMDAYTARYRESKSGRPLVGMRLGVYQHSPVTRDVMVSIFRGLGAEAVALGRSSQFVPVDTEAVDPDVRTAFTIRAHGHRLDAIVSTDGDGDRPMLTEQDRRIIQGDVLGALAARALGATHVITPVSSNTMVKAREAFEGVSRCRIGSPYVIEGIEALRATGADKGVGFEANGGFLLGFAAERDGNTMTPLLTRDFALPVISALVAAREAGKTLCRERRLAETLHRVRGFSRSTHITLSLAGPR